MFTKKKKKKYASTLRLSRGCITVQTIILDAEVVSFPIYIPSIFELYVYHVCHDAT